jgi:WD40 repeat protein
MEVAVRLQFDRPNLIALCLAAMFAGFNVSHLRADEEKVVKIQPSPGAGIWSLAVSNDGKRAVFGVGDNSVRIVDLDKFEEVQKLEGHAHPAIHRVAFSPDGKFAFSCCEAATVRQWDIEKGKEVQQFAEHKAGVKSLDVSGDGRKLLTGGLEAKLRLFDIEKGKLLNTFDSPEGTVGSPFRSVAFVPKADRVIASNAKGYIGIWDTTTGKRVALHGPVDAGTGPIACAPDGKSYASGGDTDGNLRIVHVARGQDLKTFKGHKDAVKCVAFSTDGKYLASGGADKTVRVWDVASGKEVRLFEKHTAAVNGVAFTPDGKRVLSGGDDGIVYVWSMVD